MKEMVCPNCGESLKENGFYVQSCANYEWDEKEERFVISTILPEEALTHCCDAEVEVLFKTQTMREHFQE